MALCLLVSTAAAFELDWDDSKVLSYCSSSFGTATPWTSTVLCSSTFTEDVSSILFLLCNSRLGAGVDDVDDDEDDDAAEEVEREEEVTKKSSPSWMRINDFDSSSSNRESTTDVASCAIFFKWWSAFAAWIDKESSLLFFPCSSWTSRSSRQTAFNTLDWFTSDSSSILELVWSNCSDISWQSKDTYLHLWHSWDARKTLEMHEKHSVMRSC